MPNNGCLKMSRELWSGKPSSTRRSNGFRCFWTGLVQVMDLGSGPGTLAGKLLAAFPQVSVICLDGSEEMLTQARQRLGGFGARASFLQGDFGAENWSSTVPRELGAVVSARAVHNLRKLKPIERVYRQVYQLLRPGGFFMNIERVNFSTPKLRRHYRDLQIKTRGQAAKMDGPAPSLLQQFHLLKRAGIQRYRLLLARRKYRNRRRIQEQGTGVRRTRDCTAERRFL